ncbi:(deoxy)nucleoside triphosphate pyrophosphohydrolase [Actinokineospora bangkokensis]|uniref:8-oxo-dGTP diphosphatase n=1 Tax=Actinokineospora bangkokensis TaxID=1193682 RepID=A0A1Q9LDJ7_9PSEU|nr:(deoxy)nucleoside triphosphate pyrophosphohydrolase [Actinokineospora bangkokensis]OLR90082.1 DNA mismatch repair protein MutT [Actinokineospora bangkokensis]
MIVVAAAIVRDGRVLAQQRAYPADVAGLWEFPGGRVEAGESEVDAVVRECREELGITVHVGGFLAAAPLAPGKQLRLYAATTRDDPRPVEHRDLRWVGAAELDGVDWIAADRDLLPGVRALL